VEIFTHHVGGIGAPSRRTLLIRVHKHGTMRIPPEIAERNRRANIF
jgi:hypothetical protein